jgi:mRNA-degrading endonuclease toxin of MazEF toxin-antitoxin module
MLDHPQQGEIWLTLFREGWERPAIIVSRNELNRGTTLLVVPCTSSQVETRAAYPNNVLLLAGTGGLSRDSVAQTHLVQPVGLSLLLERMGSLNDEQLAEVLLGLAWVVDFFDTTRTP